MGQYRKKPVIIDAMQFTYSDIQKCREFVGKYWIEEESNVGTIGNFIKTLEGNSYLLSNKDWIIKGVNGEFYPCKPDIFEKTYEEVWD